MNVKGQGLINGAKWIEETHGQAVLAKVLKACPATVRDSYISTTAMAWLPMQDLIDFATNADRVIGRGDGAIAQEIGAAGARANMKSVMMRIVFYIGQPEFLMRRVAGMWRQFNDEGTMEITVFESRRMVVTLKECKSLPKIFVRVLTGWATEVARAISDRNPTATVIDHVEAGDARVVWEVTWSRSITDAAEENRRQSTAPRG